MPFRSPYSDVHVPDVPLSDFVLGGVDAYADRPALVCAVSGRTLTFGELRDRVRGLAAGLSRRIGKGDVVAIWAPNLPEYAVAFHGILTIGAIVTTINPAYTVEEVAFQLRDANARMLITLAALRGQAAEAVTAARRPIEIVTFDEAPGVSSLASLAVDGDPPAVTIDPAVDVAALPYSSGTTGRSKGVMLTHRNLVANLVQIDVMERRDLTAFVGVLPFFHIYGMMVILNFALLRRATTVTLPRFELETFLRVLQDWPIAVAHIVPPIAVALAKHPVVDKYNLQGVTCLFSGAAPFGPELTSALAARLHVTVRQGYGMTECSPAAFYTAPGAEQDGTVGFLVPNTECRIVGVDTGEDVAPGAPGEVWVRGPQVMKGYLNNAEATAVTVDADGWLRTGDIGVADDEGRLTIVDRLKELIKVKGFQVAPAELESLLLEHPQIADVAVIPVADDDAGEVPKAVVVARSPLTAEEVIAFVQPRVAYYKRIRHVEFIDAIPKSPSGKILRRVLIERERKRAAGV